MPGQCAFCGAPDNEHRVTDAIVDRVMAGESIESVADDFGEDIYTPRTIYLMVSVAYSVRFDMTRKRELADKRMAEWQAFVDREPTLGGLLEEPA